MLNPVYETPNALPQVSELALRDHNKRRRAYTYRAGAKFFSPGENSYVLYIVRKGRVCLYSLSAEGRKFVFSVLGPGEIFGQVAMLGEQTHSVFAEAMSTCEVEKITRYDMECMIARDPSVVMSMMQSLVQRVTGLERRIEESAFQPMTVRLARLLLQLNAEHGHSGVLTGFTHQLLADMLGSHRETITQTLNAFKKQNLLDLGRMRIELLDPEGLACIVDEQWM